MLYPLTALVCNTLLFFVLLKNRFDLKITLIGSAATLPIALVLRAILMRKASDGGFLSPDRVEALCGVLIIFLASLVLFRNHFVQKLSLVIFGFTNYLFVAQVGDRLCGVTRSSGRGTGFVYALLYLVLTMVLFAVLYRPFRFFAEQQFCGSWIGILLLQFLLFFGIAGVFDGFFAFTRYLPKFILHVSLYCLVLLFFRMFYSAAFYGAKKATAALRENHLRSKNEQYNAMLVNIRQLRNLHGTQSPDAPLPEPATQALLANYCENPYANAVIATHASRAVQAGIRFQCTAALRMTELSTLELCTLIGDMLSKALAECEKFSGRSPFIHLSLSSNKESLVVELVNSGHPNRRQFRGIKNLLLDLLQGDNASFKKLTDLDDAAFIVNSHGGVLRVSHTENQVITRAEIYCKQQ